MCCLTCPWPRSSASTGCARPDWWNERATLRFCPCSKRQSGWWERWAVMLRSFVFVFSSSSFLLFFLSWVWLFWKIPCSTAREWSTHPALNPEPDVLKHLYEESSHGLCHNIVCVFVCFSPTASRQPSGSGVWNSEEEGDSGIFGKRLVLTQTHTDTQALFPLAIKEQNCSNGTQM